MNEQVKSISLAVIALSLFVQTIMMIAGGSDAPSFASADNSPITEAGISDLKINDPLDPHAGHDHDQAEQPEQNLPPTTIEFEKTEYDFGTMPQNQKKMEVFTFTNTGSNPLVIQNARGSCGCTVPEWPKEPIPPGGKGEIKVEFDSRTFTGQQNKTVTITANTEPKVSQLKVSANVDPGA